MASNSAGPSFVTAVSPPYESDVEAELEVDQLDSDSEEVDELADPAKPATSKNGGTRPGERVPGHTLLPASRIENMIQADGVTGSMAMSKEASFVLSIATEEFIKTFIQAGHREANVHRRNQINYLDMATTTQQYQEFMFLSDTIPPPMSLVDAIVHHREKQKELFEDNPALAPLSPPPSTWMPPPPVPHSSRPGQDLDASAKPKKSRSSTNGKDHKRPSKKSATNNGHAASMPVPAPEAEAMDVSVSYSENSGSHRKSSRHGTSASAAVLPQYSNGTQTPPFEEPMDATSHHPPAQYPGAHSPPYTGEEEPTWNDQPPSTLNNSSFPEPSGSTKVSTTPFSRSTQNPGRTIYSQGHS
ncbi:hypothetical protein CPB83DRAFT_844276 [Crepidotus variabilis]|uniref:Transcription factor CBF/NF-Y/archaeal histone domain-containing protein n=1 Tax=Crepidotus variabilis TaxID=179855 RepID=A0A9P6ESR3_9AGAR|nr:hypothetical protein CPB83DRAFT_844276 [Crepidotus variabilis]